MKGCARATRQVVRSRRRMGASTSIDSLFRIPRPRFLFLRGPKRSSLFPLRPATHCHSERGPIVFHRADEESAVVLGAGCCARTYPPWAGDSASRVHGNRLCSAELHRFREVLRKPRVTKQAPSANRTGELDGWACYQIRSSGSAERAILYQRSGGRGLAKSSQATKMRTITTFRMTTFRSTFIEASLTPFRQ